MLWVVYSSVACNHISTEYRDKVKSDLADTGIQVGEGQNPIIKMLVIVSGDQGTVYIDELQPMPGGLVVENNGAPDAAMNVLDNGVMRDLNVRMLNNNQASGNQLQNWMLQLQSGFMTLRRENIELRNEISAMMLAMERGFHVVNGNVRRVALQPVARTRVAAAAGGGAAGAGVVIGGDDERALLAPALAVMTSPATLMANPKSLYDVWNEYLHGVGGRKPARLFSEAERGRVKFKYSRRKVIWDVVRKMVSLGHTANRAIDLIYEVYGPQTSVTEIINRLRRDKNNGTLNPNLQM